MLEDQTVDRDQLEGMLAWGLEKDESGKRVKENACTRPIFPVVFTSTLGKNVLKMEVI